MVASLQATMAAGVDYEIILVDDGSTDGTREWLAALSHPFRIRLNQSNLGYAAANNRGADLAKADLLFLLNNDLILTPDWMEPMLAAHRGLGPRAGMIGNVQLNAQSGKVDHAGIFINYKGKPEHVRQPPSLWSRAFVPVRPSSVMTGACVLVSRELWQELGGFDESYVNGCEDIDFCLRAEAAGRTNAIALRSRVLHHVSTSPGRKVWDEANTHRFTRRWRERLVSLGQRDWCRHHFETYLREPRDFPDPTLARQVFWYLSGLRRQPPPGASAGMEAAIEVELSRWRDLFGGPAPPLRWPDRRLPG